jgi:hypothetical protein
VSQRDSGYDRKERDAYETPEWVTLALLPHIDSVQSVWEPAAGAGQMAQALSAAGLHVTATDISTGHDFLLATAKPVDAIVTNPPYALAQEFIEHALALIKPNGMIAMLLRCDFDHAKTRQHLFGSCPQFAKKLVLTRRIRWIEGSNGSPSFNHAWFIWDHRRRGSPVLAYGP